MNLILFYSLAVLLVVFAVLTVTAHNPVRSAVYLISALLQMAGLFLLMQAEFLAMVQILVYVGGIMVLFLFVIMLVSVREAERGRRSIRAWKTPLVLGLVLLAELIFLMVGGARVLTVPAGSSSPLQLAQNGNTESVGMLLYRNYLLPFEMASILLLVAIIGAVVMAKKQL